MNEAGPEPDLPPRIYLAVAVFAVVLMVVLYAFTAAYQIPLPEAR